MCATSANLIERVMPQVDLRQWVLNYLYAWHRRLAQDGALLSTLTRLFLDTVQGFYAKRAAARGGATAVEAKSVTVTVVQRTSPDFQRTFEIDALECPSCPGRMKLVSLVTEPQTHRHAT